MAPGKKNAARLGAHIVFIDESGFMLIPHVRKTWAPRGQTPIHKHRYSHDKISAISALTISPGHKRLGLYFHLHLNNIGQEEVCSFVRSLLRHLRGNVVIVWDNSRTHKGSSVRDLCRRFPRLHLEAFPPYAPELNPDEGVWQHLKRSLSNGRPDNLDELIDALICGLERLKGSPSLLKAFVRHSTLPLFLP
jgi:transposase